MNWRDPFGLYSEVIIWEPYGWRGSSFGHVSVNINGKNYSFGPGGWDTRYPSAAEYASRQQQFRTGIGVILDLKPNGEAELSACLKKEHKRAASPNINFYFLIAFEGRAAGALAGCPIIRRYVNLGIIMKHKMILI